MSTYFFLNFSKSCESKPPSDEIYTENIVSEEEEKISKNNKANVSRIESPQKTLASPELAITLLEMNDRETYGIPELKQQDEQLKENEKIPMPIEEVEKDTDDEGNAPITVEEMIERSLQDGKIDKSDLEVNSSVKQTGSEEIKSEVSLLEASNTEPDCETSEDHAGPEMQDVQQIPNSNITIAGQQVTFEERDGETVAIVTIPSSLEESQTQMFPVSTSEERRANNQSLTEMVSVIPNSHGGHSVITGKAEDNTAVAASQKLTIEARQFSSLLKPKVKTTNPVTCHGRVIPRNEQQMTAMIFKSGVGSPSLTPASSFITVSSAQDIQSQKGSLKYSLLPSLQQTPTTENSKVSSHGSITPRGNQKVIIVSQKSTDNSAGTNVSTLKSPTGQAQLILPASGGSSTLIHVKKAEGSSLSASDLECILKALSGKNISEGESISISEETLPAVTSEETPALIDSEHPENKVSKEGNRTSSPEIEKEEGDVLGHMQELDKSENGAESLIQDTTNVEISQNANSTDEADNLTENTEKEDTNTNSAHVNNGEVSSESVKIAIESASEDTPNENLPVESALYQALQALEPSNVPSEQTSHSEGAENAITSDLSVRGGTEGEDRSSGSEKWTVKGETIKVVDNGIEYDVRIVCQEDVAEEIIDDSTEQVS